MSIKNVELNKMVVSRFKSIGGKRFRLWNKYKTKTKAKKTASLLRQSKQNARVVKTGNYYHVYNRPKKKRK